MEEGKEAIVTINEKGIVLTVNENFSRIFGFKKSEILGKNISKIVPEPFRSQHDDYLVAFLGRGNENSAIINRSREVVALRKDGTPLSIQIAVTIQSRTPDGGYVFCGKLHDLSSTRTLDRWLKKSVFEQSLFGMLYALTQGNKAPRRFISILAVFIDFCSILSFNFRQGFPWGPSLTSFMPQVLSFTSNPLLHIPSYDLARVVWALIASFLFIAFLDTAYVAWAFQSNHVRFIAAVKLLRVVVSYVVTTLFVTLLGVLLFPLDCQISGQSTPRLSLFPEVACWGATNAPVAAFSLIIALLFTAFSWCVAYMPRDPHPSSENMLSAFNSKFDIISVILRTLQSLTSTFLSDNMPIIAAVNFLSSLGYLSSFLYFSPHFRPKLNLIRSGLFTCIVWSSCCLIAAMSTEDAANNEFHSYLFVAGLVPAFGLGVLFCKIRFWYISYKWQKIRLPPPPPTTRSRTTSFMQSPRSSDSLSGGGGCPVIHNNSAGPTSVPNSETRVLPRRKKTGEAAKFSNELEVELLVHFLTSNAMKDSCEDPRAMLDEAKEVLQSGIAQFPRSGTLLVTFALFSKEIDYDLVSSIENFERAKSMQTQVPLRFIMYSHFKDEENRYRSAEAGEAGLGLVELVELRKNQEMARKYHLSSVKNIKQMWRALLPEKVDVSVLPDIMQRIYVNQSKADQLFEDMLEKYKESPRLLRCFAMYLNDVKNDPSQANAYYKMADEVEDRNSHVHQEDDEPKKESMGGSMPHHPPQGGKEAPSVNGDMDGKSVNEMSQAGSNFSAGTSASLMKMRKKRSKKQDPVFRLHVKIVLLLVCIFIFILASLVTVQSILASLQPQLSRMHENGTILYMTQRVVYAANFLSENLLQNTAVPKLACPSSLQRSLSDAESDRNSIIEVYEDFLLSNDFLNSKNLENFLYDPAIHMCYQSESSDCARNFIEAVQDFNLATESIFHANNSLLNNANVNTTCVGCDYLLKYGPNQMFEASKTFSELQRQSTEATTDKAFMIQASAQAISIFVLFAVVRFIIHPSVKRSCAGYFHTYHILLKIPKTHVEARLHMNFHILSDPENEDHIDDMGGDIHERRNSRTSQDENSFVMDSPNEDLAASPRPPPPLPPLPPSVNFQNSGFAYTAARAMLTQGEHVPSPHDFPLRQFSSQGRRDSFCSYEDATWTSGYNMNQQPEYSNIPGTPPYQHYPQEDSYYYQNPAGEYITTDTPNSTKNSVAFLDTSGYLFENEQEVRFVESQQHEMEGGQFLEPPAGKMGFFSQNSSVEELVFVQESSGQSAHADFQYSSAQGDFGVSSHAWAAPEHSPISPNAQSFYHNVQPPHQYAHSTSVLTPLSTAQPAPSTPTPSSRSRKNSTAKKPTILDEGKQSNFSSLSEIDQQQPSTTQQQETNNSKNPIIRFSRVGVEYLKTKFLSKSETKSHGTNPEVRRVRQLSAKYFSITFVIAWLLIGSIIMFSLNTNEIIERQNEIASSCLRQGLAQRLLYFSQTFSYHFTSTALSLNSDWLPKIQKSQVDIEMKNLINLNRELLYGSSDKRLQGNLFRSRERFDLYFGCSETLNSQCVGLLSLFQNMISKINALTSSTSDPMKSFSDFCEIEPSIFVPTLHLMHADNDLILDEALASVSKVSTQQGIMFAVATVILIAMHLLVFWPLVRVMRTEEHMMRMMLLMLPTSLVQKVPEIQQFLLSIS